MKSKSIILMLTMRITFIIKMIMTLKLKTTMESIIVILELTMRITFIIKMIMTLKMNLKTPMESIITRRKTTKMRECQEIQKY